MVQSTQTGTAYTLASGDAGSVVRLTNASAVTVTVPPSSSVSWQAGTIINLYAEGAGGLTVSAGAGVTIENNATATLAQYGECSLRYDGSDVWVRVG